MSNKLKEQYEKCCNEYIEIFSKKHGIEFYFWIGDEVGSVSCFNHDFFFNFTDITFDINTNQPKNLIIEWHEREDLNINVNFSSYAKGFTYEKPIFKIN